MRVFIILLFGLAWSGVVLATSLEHDHVRRLARARTPAAVAKAVADFENLKVARAACRIQVREKRLPLACYEALNLEIRQGLRPARPDSGRRGVLHRLDELCRETAAALTVPELPVSPHETSPACRKYLAEARSIRNYRDRRPDWSGY